MSTRHLRGLADTNILIHLGRLSAGDLPAELLTSAITLAELSAGVHQTGDPAERGRRMARLQRVEAIFEPLPFDAEAARQYGAIVAGVAAAHRLPLYTTNPDDFLGAEGTVTVVAVPRPAIV